MTVLIVGAGPVGMLLAAELARLGVEARVRERRADVSTGSRAVGLHPTALAAMEASGATERILQDARRVRIGEARSRGRTLGVVRFDRGGGAYPFVATLAQQQTEAALMASARAWDAAPVHRGIAVSAIQPDAAGVTVHLDDGAQERASLVVVAGGTSARTLIPTAGRRTRYPDRYLMADADDAGDDGDVAVVHLDPEGVLESFPLPGGRRRYVAWVGGGREGGPALSQLRQAVARRTGSPAAAEPIVSATGFGVGRALVRSLRAGRVLAVGDAAHEVSPIGGQGMNLGLIDVVTLAPLLVSWVRAGEAPAAIDAWARRRRRAAQLSARIAAANTRVGRPSRVAPSLVRTLLRGPGADILARAYAMGFDPDAAGFGSRWPGVIPPRRRSLP